jgi:hypothetical protein
MPVSIQAITEGLRRMLKRILAAARCESGVTYTESRSSAVFRKTVVESVLGHAQIAWS